MLQIMYVTGQVLFVLIMFIILLNYGKSKGGRKSIAFPGGDSGNGSSFCAPQDSISQ